MVPTHKDHPRACGEHLNLFPASLAVQGSPPRMRGAYECIRSGEGKNKDHPRACGEHQTRWISALDGKGSPPRMRGALIFFVIFFFILRITPAHAGSI